MLPSHFLHFVCIFPVTNSRLFNIVISLPYYKILIVSVLLEHPTILCHSTSVGEETALELLSVFSHTPQKSISLKCNVMLAITNVIICTSCLATHTKMAEDWLDLLFQTIQDTNDYRCGLSQQILLTLQY